MKKGIITTILAIASSIGMASAAEASTLVQVTIENLTPEGGLALSPVWVGFHDGSFDILNIGDPADFVLGTDAVERVAEDGDTSQITEDFAGAGFDVQATLPGAIAPGGVNSQTFEVDSSLQYFSFISMILPSNDAFISNPFGNPLAFEVFDDAGNFVGGEFIITGTNVYDAGTEFNDESPDTTAPTQLAPDFGTETPGGLILQHPGFIGSLGSPDGTPIILASNPNGDFTSPSRAEFQVAQITIEAVPVPEPTTTFGLFALGGLFFVRRTRSTKKN